MLLEHLLQFYLSFYTSVNKDSWRWLVSLFGYCIFLYGVICKFVN